LIVSSPLMQRIRVLLPEQLGPQTRQEVAPQHATQSLCSQNNLDALGTVGGEAEGLGRG
jgi:hypothetical protein